MRRLTAVVATCAALAFAGQARAQFRTIDGSGNNPQHPTWGAADTDLMRRAPSDYGDGISTPAGATRPSARVISNDIVAQTGSKLNFLKASDFVWQWGQFVDHDLDLTGSATPVESFDVPVPAFDPFFDPTGTGTQVIALMRSHFDSLSSPREQVNEITSFLDASMVYGSDTARSLELRTLDGTGMLKTSAGNLLPFNVHGFPNAPTANDPTLFLAGDVRCNEQVGLTAMHTLFVREHNFLALSIGQVYPTLNDEARYQMARMLVGAEIQRITYEEFLPMILGAHALAPYAGFQGAVQASIANEFSTAGYRFGHSMLSPTLLRLDATMNPIPAGNLPLKNAFFNPQEILNFGIDPLLRGLAVQRAQELDNELVDDVRNFLFGPPGAGGFDLASLNIQRGRDHGLASYNATRLAYGLPKVTSFAQVTRNPVLQQKLASTYATVDDMDLWVAGLCEDHVRGAMVGITFRAILTDQFTRLRDGDHYWYEGALPNDFQRFVKEQSLTRIIRRNTGIGLEMPANPFRTN